MQLCMRFHKNYLGYYWSLPLFDGNDRRYRKRKGQMSESEIMTIMICRQIGTCCIFFFENKPQALPVDLEKTRPLELLLVGLILNLSTI